MNLPYELIPSMTKERIEEKRQEAVDYLIERRKHVFQKTFKSTSAAKTNIQKTMRNYVQEVMPEARRQYSFLFK